MQIVGEALRNDNLTHKDLTIPLARLQTLAHRDANRKAMILLGQVLETENKHDEALALFRAAAADNDDLGVGRDVAELGDALVAQGQNMLFGPRNQRDLVLATATLERAALECDNPLAYYYLAGLQEPMSKTQETYLLKAAMSGVVDAMHAVGVLYQDRAAAMATLAETSSQDPLEAKEALVQQKETYDFATEFFQAACEMGNGPAMLALAMLLKDEGRREEGMQWLLLAERQPGIEARTAWARKYWETTKEETPKFVPGSSKAGAALGGFFGGPRSYWTNLDAEGRLEEWHKLEGQRKGNSRAV